MMKTIESTEAFNQAINSPHTVIVKFETSWCPDCKRLNTYVDDLVSDFPFQWVSVDRDKFTALGEKYDVLGIPSLLAFKKGEKIAHLRADNQTPEQIRDYLSHLGK
jgi:thiol-disulfide isomerase/thioredoxin